MAKVVKSHSKQRLNKRTLVLSLILPKKQEKVKKKVEYQMMHLHGQSTEEQDIQLSERKDDHYWIKRTKNNESARKSRMKRKAFNQEMEKQIKYLMAENLHLRFELATSMKTMYVGKSVEEVKQVGTLKETNHLLYKHKYVSSLGSSESDSDELRGSPSFRAPFLRNDSYSSSCSESGYLGNPCGLPMKHPITDMDMEDKQYQYLLKSYGDPMRPTTGHPLFYNHQMQYKYQSVDQTYPYDFSLNKKQNVDDGRILNIPATSRYRSSHCLEEREYSNQQTDDQESSEETQTYIHPKIRIKQKIHSAFSIDD